MSEFKADMHCHTTASDGSLDPKQIIDLAVEGGLKGISITDHDTIDAYEIAAPYAKKKGIYLGTGVEFSCEWKGHSLHVLGYDFSLEDSGFLTYCIRQQTKRGYRNQEILEKLAALKIDIKPEDLFLTHEKASTLGRPHIAAAMVRKGYVKTIQEAFQFYLGDGKRCFVPGEPFPVEEAIDVIHKAEGKAFLAHPHLYPDSSLVRSALVLAFDGVECFYGRAPLFKTKRWKKLAEQKGLLISGGSDFHGEAKPHINLGSSWVDQELFFKIFNRHLITP
jgi:predicted metal-dependent phosphoesterase TrpH